MKKLILIAAMAVLSLNLVSCGGESNKPKNDKEITSESTENETSTSVKTILGQVSDKVGNDIILSLGNFIVDNNGAESETYIYDGTGEPRPYDEGNDSSSDAGQTLMIPVPDDESSDSGNGSTSTSEIEKLPIEFTGEVRDFTIPAGVKITNTLGKEVNFESVKKGSLVQIVVNEKTNIVESLMVW